MNPSFHWMLAVLLVPASVVAESDRHWAFAPPSRPAVPEVDDTAWPRGPIDRFVLARLDAEGISPSPEAKRQALVRRLYLDLIGLPPTVAEADEFIHDAEPDAREQLTDRLLASARYGERWARPWLDLARYADTNGYEKDRPRSVWPYRDWVIRALNGDRPFDQFTVEQIAGDMLPGATVDQRIATGFHRNTMLNEEGGIDPLEFRFHAMVDRVATTGVVWMGLTTGCAQCHSHKYDPISHAEYYRLMALLDNADEPDLSVPDADILARRKAIENEIARLESHLPEQFPAGEGNGPLQERRQRALDLAFAEWLRAAREYAVDWRSVRPHAMESNSPKLVLQPDDSVFTIGDITKRDVFTLRYRLPGFETTALRLEVLPDDRLPGGGPGRSYYEGRNGDFFLSEFTAKIDGKPVKFGAASHDYGRISIGSGDAKAGNVIDGDGSTGWSTAGREGEPHQLVLNLEEPLPANAELEVELLFERHFAASLGRFRMSAASTERPATANLIRVELEATLASDPAGWPDSARDELRRFFLRVAPELQNARRPIEELRKRLPALPTTLVMLERPADHPRPTFRHNRGEYLQPRDRVTPAIPEIFAGLTDDPPTDRLEFARWLVSGGNPAVGRVTVNRAWRAFFGAGLVRTNGDYGTQSPPPTHPELLDWLAVEFVESGWSVKNLHRSIVTSVTYRQSSRATGEDPENRLLARGPRFRVDAETVRDIMLRASGLLSDQMHGQSVYPPQPASVTDLAYGNVKWPTSVGADRYRRSLYTFAKRTTPFAAYTVFDGPTGEGCVVRRNRGNTPLQALTLLNDEMFLELVRGLARRAVDAEDPARFVFRSVLTREPSDGELSALREYQRRQLRRLDDGELSPTEIAKDDAATPELASWVMVARVVMNLDEAVSKP